MMTFEEYLADGTIQKRSPDTERAKFLRLEAEEKKKFLELLLKALSFEKLNFNLVIDCVYDIVMENIRARMLIDGFYAGASHEAEVSYSPKLGFSLSEVEFLDQLRFRRNGTKYYGKRLDGDYAKKVLAFLEKVYGKVKR